MYKKIIGIFVLITFSLFYIIPANATTSSPTTGAPLKQLTTMERLAQSLGMSVEDIQAEVDTGKTLQQVATNHGMPAANYKARVLNANFKLLSAKKVPVKKVVKKVVTKTVVKKTPVKVPAKAPVKTVVKKTVKK